MTELYTEKNLPLRDSSALDIRFKQNDLRLLSHEYKGATAATWREPDVIITSRTLARDAVAEGGKVPKSKSTYKRKREDEEQDEEDEHDWEAHDDDEDTNHQHGQEEKEYESAPTAQGKFGWRGVLSCREFKRVSKERQCAPEACYEDTDRKVMLSANREVLALPVDSSEGLNPASA